MDDSNYQLDPTSLNIVVDEDFIRNVDYSEAYISPVRALISDHSGTGIVGNAAISEAILLLSVAMYTGEEMDAARRAAYNILPRTLVV